MAIKKASLTYPDMRCLAEHAANRFPDGEFFLCADEEMPYVRGSELFGFCKKAAPVLDAIPVGRHIALLGPGSAAWLAVYFAVLSAGRVIVPLHDGMQQQELEDCLRLADCGLLLYDERRGGTAAVLAQAIPGLALLELHEFTEKMREEKKESLPSLDPASVKFDHRFVFDAHNYNRKQLITRWRGTVVERTHLGYAVTGCFPSAITGKRPSSA